MGSEEGGEKGECREWGKVQGSWTGLGALYCAHFMLLSYDAVES